MPEPTAPAGDTPPAAAPNPAPGTAAERPAWLPEKYWNPEKGEALFEQLAADHTELGQRFAKGKEALAPELRAEWEAERRQGVPETPDAYALAPPSQMPEGIVLLAEPPAADFQPEPGKTYFVMQPDHPLLGWWREAAHKAGLSQEAFAEGIAQFAAAQGWREPTAEDKRAAQQAFYSSLGERGVERVNMLWGRLKSTLGEKAAALDAVVTTKEQVEALEDLVARASGASFTPGQAAAPDVLTEAELQKIQQDPRYFRDHDPALVKKVEEGYARLYPGMKR